MIDKKKADRIKEQLISQLNKLPEEQAFELKEKINGMNSEELEKFVQQQIQHTKKSGKRQCLFCQIIQGLIETIKIYEDNQVLAILDIMPAQAGHAIIMPKQHYQFLFQMPEDALLHLIKVTSLLEEIVVNSVKANGMNICILQGESADQTVPHLAINLIPRKEKDNLNLSWPRNKVDKSELEKLAKEMNEKILNDLEIKKKDGQKIDEEGIKEKNVEKAIKKEKSETEKILEHMKKRLP